MSSRDTLSGATRENGHKNLGLRVEAQESPVHFQKKTIIQGEERERQWFLQHLERYNREEGRGDGISQVLLVAGWSLQVSMR